MIYKTLPPVVPELEKISIFEDGLRDSVPVKIEEILNRMDFLVEKRKTLLEAIKKCKRRGELDEISQYFAVLLMETEYEEYFFAKKWLRYWLEIYGCIAPEFIGIKKEYVDSFKIMETFNEAKKHPIEDFYEGNLRSIGSRLSGRCPFHVEKTPSFMIYADSNTFYCFGCQEGGDVIDFIMKKKNCTFREALELL